MKITVLNENIIPNIYIMADTLRLMQQLVANCKGEIGWLALCKKENENDYVIYDIEICEQECGATHTDLMESGLQEIASKFIKNDRIEEMNNVRVWCHSHVDMPVMPSGQDDDTLEEYYENCDDYFIRIIMNKSNEVNLSFVDKSTGLQFDNLELYTLYSKEEYEIITKLREHKKHIEALEEVLKEKNEENVEIAKTIAKELIKTHVKEKYPIYNYNWKSKTQSAKKEEKKNKALAKKTKNCVREEIIYYDYAFNWPEHCKIPLYENGKLVEKSIDDFLEYDDVYYIASFGDEMAKEALKEYAFTDNYSDKELSEVIDICRDIVKYVDEIIDYETYEEYWGGYVA